MRKKEGYKPEYKNGSILAVSTIEKRLRTSFVFLLMLMLISQILLYNKIGNKLLNPVYQMEGNLFTEQEARSIYNILCIHGGVPEFEDVRVLKNGIPVGQLVKGIPVYVYVFAGDILEIDASHASGFPHDIFIENMSSGLMPEGFPNKILLRDNIYRLPPFYNI